MTDADSVSKILLLPIDTSRTFLELAMMRDFADSGFSPLIDHFSNLKSDRFLDC